MKTNHIYADDGTKIGSYKYDAWGNVTSATISSTTTLQKQIVRQYNPFRYRGYYYDTQTSLYYLQSRYYDPATGRFINADGYVSTGTGLLGYNMYAYCNNNPVMNVDPSGEIILEIILATFLLVSVGLLLSSCSSNTSTESTEYIEVDEKLYSNIEDAVFDFGNNYLDKSISENREYRTFIYKVEIDEKNYYTYSIVSVGNHDTTHQILPSNVKNNQVSAIVHTHGAPMSEYSNSFSPTDKANASKWKVSSYLFTPSKELYRYDYKNGSIWKEHNWEGN